jgi:two-component system sensor histidine kinase HydH
MLTVALLLASALVTSTVLNYRDTASVAESLATHQGLEIFRRLPIDWRVGKDVLRDELTHAVGAGGAAYLGLWESEHLLASAGQAEFSDLMPTPLRLQVGRDHARMSFPGLFLGSPDRKAPGFAPSRSEGTLASDRIVVLEFEPTMARQLVRRALAGLLLSSSAAVLLLMAAVVLWHLGRRAQLMEAEFERQRHLAKLGAMSAVLAHEIRNPLSSLKGHAQLLAENPRGPRTEPRIERIVAGALRLEALTNDLLDFARSGAVHPTRTSPLKILEAAASTTEPDRIELSFSEAPESWSLDPVRMEQVLVNLLSNALAVTPKGAAVSANVARFGDELVYAVRDRGPGVPASERAQIFEPFHTTRVRGTGLGLAVARRIVELHRGHIEVDDAPDGGAVFRVHIPASAEAGQHTRV